ncbi:hypothetical protein ACP70R_043078 [Stipagrostis hirtigluma subsp. patula]
MGLDITVGGRVSSWHCRRRRLASCHGVGAAEASVAAAAALVRSRCSWRAGIRRQRRVRHLRGRSGGISGSAASSSSRARRRQWPMYRPGVRRGKRPQAAAWHHGHPARASARLRRRTAAHLSIKDTPISKCR